jgi:hypothetical protein
MKLYLYIFFTFICFVTVAQPPAEETLTNETIIQLTKAGLDKDVIKSKINTSKCNFTTTTADLISLSKNKVNGEVINLMIKKENSVKNNPASTPIDIEKFNGLKYGVYLYDTAIGKYVEIKPSLVLDKNSAEFEDRISSGLDKLFSSKEFASIKGLSASTKFYSYKPLLFFVFDTTATAPKRGNIGWENITSPNDFFLIKMSTTKNNREFGLGKNSTTGTEIAVSDKIKIPFSTRKLRKGVFMVYPTDPILKGEYCFAFVSAFKFTGTNRKLYDFSIR